MERGTVVWSVVWILLIGCALYNDAEYPYECVQNKTVSKILSVHYRSATLEFTDGTTTVADQATAQPGTQICTKYERKQ